MLRLLVLLSVIVLNVAAADHEIEVNYDVRNYKMLHINQTLELVCKNKLNRDPPSWTYYSRLYNDPRMRFYTDVGESRLVISNATAEDAGQYRCSIEHEYNDKTHHINRTIEVMANDILDIEQEKNNDSLTLTCNVKGYPSPKVIWKIDYDNKELNPQPEEPDLEDEYWVPPEENVVVDKSDGRWTLRPYKGVNNAELIINKFTDNDNGKYYCIARNIAGAVEKSSSIFFKSTTEPAVLDIENSQKGLSKGEVAAIVSGLIVIGLIIVGVVYLIKRSSGMENQQLKRETTNETLLSSGNSSNDNSSACIFINERELQ